MHCIQGVRHNSLHKRSKKRLGKVLQQEANHCKTSRPDGQNNLRTGKHHELMDLRPTWKGTKECWNCKNFRVNNWQAVDQDLQTDLKLSEINTIVYILCLSAKLKECIEWHGTLSSMSDQLGIAIFVNVDMNAPTVYLSIT